jgi:nucleotide-binding universal stress UspA family protein
MPKKPKVVLATSKLNQNPDPAIVSGTRLSALTRSALHVFHCVAPGSSIDAIDAASRSLHGQTPRGTPVTVVSGTPHEEIASHTVRTAADIVVLGPRLDASAFAGLLGGTAHRVLRATRVPCLLANAELPEETARILLAMDWSDPGRSAFHACVGLVAAIAENPSRSTHLHVHLLTISAFARPGRRTVRAVGLKPFAERLSAALDDPDAVEVSDEVLSAALPAEGILARAETYRPDLLVMGTHGSGLTTRLLLGSVAHEIAQSAAVPLLLVPPTARTVAPGGTVAGGSS